jgi:hypothetical protein
LFVQAKAIFPDSFAPAKLFFTVFYESYLAVVVFSLSGEILQLSCELHGGVLPGHIVPKSVPVASART